MAGKKKSTRIRRNSTKLAIIQAAQKDRAILCTIPMPQGVHDERVKHEVVETFVKSDENC